MNQSTWIRPDWTPATIAMMVLGFVIFWPLGLAMLAYILFGDRLQEFKRDANKMFDGKMRRGAAHHHFGRAPYGASGNAAFDDWRKQELERIEEERRKLDEMKAEFDGYLQELRRAKDQEEFSRFMRERKEQGGTGPQAA